ncbi:unknown [Bacteroides sp. CAG:702]|nr:unknown [Bacteroides sp. CAG:702]
MNLKVLNLDTQTYKTGKTYNRTKLDKNNTKPTNIIYYSITDRTKPIISQSLSTSQLSTIDFPSVHIYNEYPTQQLTNATSYRQPDML